MTKSEEYINETIHMYKDSSDIFEKRLLTNEITCIDPYFDILQTDTTLHNLITAKRSIMAKHGYYIEKLIELNNKYVLADLVRYDHAQEYYEEWAKNADGEVQKELLNKGLYVDILSQSKDANVRFAVAKKYPERTLFYLKQLDSEKQRDQGFLLLMAQKEPNIKALEFLLNLDWCNSSYNLQILKSKYELMHLVPTTIEKTMTPYQLYKANNAFWMANLSGYNIASVQQGQEKFNDKNIFMNEHAFNQLATYDNEYCVDFYIDYNLTNRKD